MSKKFINDTRGNTYSLKPILVVDEGGTESIYLSTHNLILDDIQKPIYNILKDVPRIRETIDTLKTSINNNNIP